MGDYGLNAVAWSGRPAPSYGVEAIVLLYRTTTRLSQIRVVTWALTTRS